MTISSQHNRRLKEIRKLRMRRRVRERSARFVAEGEDLLTAADAAGWEALERYCAAGSGLPGVEVEPKLLAQASGLGSGTRTLAVYEERWLDRPVGPLCVCLHGVHDPGNVGTILRSAAAFGASCVAIGPGTADPFGPKAVRASMGAVFQTPVVRAHTLEDLPGTLVALVADTGADELWQISSDIRSQNAKVRDWTVLIGSEREGLPAEVVARVDHAARIAVHTDSLNAAIAASIALYEITRISTP
jgi:RNA methyltransferase, TrmH family